MPEHQNRSTATATPSNANAAGGPSTDDNVHVVSNAAVQDMVNSGTVDSTTGEVKDPTEVVLYLTLNNTTHRQDEIPETISALKQAEKEGLGHRELMAISDPYWSKSGEKLSYGEGTYSDVLGEKAANRVEWWHGNDTMTAGQVKIGDQVLGLGTEGVGDDKAKQTEVVNNWQTTVMTLGMDEASAKKLTTTLFQDGKGKFRGLDSGAGATNELVQFAMAMYRAEKGEINIKNIVFSGHHWRDENYEGHGQGIWGEVAGGVHEYDDISDYFSLVDVAILKDVFPNAYAQVKTVQLAACNTDDLGMKNDAGEDITTNQFLQDTFKNIEMSSYWKKVLAPLAASGAETNGEFILDSMRMEGARSDDPARDSRHNTKGLKRSLLNGDGNLEEISMKTNKSSYTPTASGLGGGAQRDGLRDKNQNYDKRTDLAKWFYSAESLAEVKAGNDSSSLEEPKPEEVQAVIQAAEQAGSNFWNWFSW